MRRTKKKKKKEISYRLNAYIQRYRVFPFTYLNIITIILCLFPLGKTTRNFIILTNANIDRYVKPNGTLNTTNVYNLMNGKAIILNAFCVVVVR